MVAIALFCTTRKCEIKVEEPRKYGAHPSTHHIWNALAGAYLVPGM